MSVQKDYLKAKIQYEKALQERKWEELPKIEEDLISKEFKLVEWALSHPKMFYIEGSWTKCVKDIIDFSLKLN